MKKITTRINPLLFLKPEIVSRVKQLYKGINENFWYGLENSENVDWYSDPRNDPIDAALKFKKINKL